MSNALNALKALIQQQLSSYTYKQWPEIFNHDTTLTAALLDRILHQVETILIEGRSYRTKEPIEQP